MNPVFVFYMTAGKMGQIEYWNFSWDKWLMLHKFNLRAITSNGQTILFALCGNS